MYCICIRSKDIGIYYTILLYVLYLFIVISKLFLLLSHLHAEVDDAQAAVEDGPPGEGGDGGGSLVRTRVVRMAVPVDQHGPEEGERHADGAPVAPHKTRSAALRWT